MQKITLNEQRLHNKQVPRFLYSALCCRVWGHSLPSCSGHSACFWLTAQTLQRDTKPPWFWECLILPGLAECLTPDHDRGIASLPIATLPGGKHHNGGERLALLDDPRLRIVYYRGWEYRISDTTSLPLPLHPTANEASKNGKRGARGRLLLTNVVWLHPLPRCLSARPGVRDRAWDLHHALFRHCGKQQLYALYVLYCLPHVQQLHVPDSQKNFLQKSTSQTWML